MSPLIINAESQLHSFGKTGDGATGQHRERAASSASDDVVIIWAPQICSGERNPSNWIAFLTFGMYPPPPAKMLDMTTYSAV